jgi:EAL domain-containing protein (putative c-di-GMP-specific phosphodiesterase class I)
LLRDRPEVASRLVIEITETAALSDIEECARFVEALRALGCRVAIDDFGVGFTSLRHLQMLACDTVKIDGLFVRDLATKVENQVFLRHLVGLAHGLGFTTVAEGVEDEDQAAILRREGVLLLQGYYYAKPTIDAPWNK